MAGKRSDHPLALLFWSQIGLAYSLPVALEIAYRSGRTVPGRGTYVACLVWPAAMVMLAIVLVRADFTRIYAVVTRTARRLPGIGVGAVYALAAFIGLALWREGARNATIAWADYAVHGTVMGILVLLLALVVEVFAATVLACQVVALARRWRRLGRRGPTPARN